MSEPNDETAGHIMFIRALLTSLFQLSPTAVIRINRAYNNFVYHITLTPQTNGAQVSPYPNPGVIPIPKDVSNLVVRLPNPAANVNEEVRVENEVAAMALFRTALAPMGSSIIPDVYGWQNAGGDTKGYILEQWMEGQTLEEVFWTLNFDSKRVVLKQLARIVKSMQEYQLPPTVKGHGGLRFDEREDIITGPMTSPYGGPFASVGQMYLGMLRSQLTASDRSTVLDGWRKNEVRERLDRFVAMGAERLVREIQDDRPVLVHGDFCLQNLLVDPTSLRITALLDFDFAHVACVIDEYFYSFEDFHGLLPGPYHRSAEQLAVRNALLNGFPGSFPPSALPSSDPEKPSDLLGVQGKVAKTWDEELQRVGAKRPRTIKGAGEVAALYSFAQEMCPWYFMQERWVKMQTEEQLGEEKKKGEETVVQYLESWGF